MRKRSLSARLRFEIFKRDGFCCVYCGATPLQSPLHVDHVEAVANGGDDDPANLVTACDKCNLGKSAVPLGRRALSPTRTTDPQRDQAEQIREYLEVQRGIEDAGRLCSEELCRIWEERLYRDSTLVAPHFRRLLKEFPFDRLVEAIGIVEHKELFRVEDQVKYFFGILRRWREQAQLAASRRDVDERRAQEDVERVQGEARAAVERDWDDALIYDRHFGLRHLKLQQLRAGGDTRKVQRLEQDWARDGMLIGGVETPDDTSDEASEDETVFEGVH